MDELRQELLGKGTLDSSGSFTIALERLAEKLGAFALPSVEACVLRMLAAAVAGGASYFQYEGLPTGYRVRYDGRPVDLEELLGMQEPELAIALYTAAARGVRVRVNDCLTVERGTWRTHGESTGETRVEVTWPGLKQRLLRLRGGRELPLLASRGRWAPLELRGVTLRSLGARQIVRLGEPPLDLPASETRAAPVPGAGYVLLDTVGSEASAIVDGVAIPLGSAAPNVTFVWWAQRATLDLTREALVGEELPASLERVLVDVLSDYSTPDSPWAAWLASRGGEARVFRMLDGRDVTLADLRQIHDRDGYLAVSQHAFGPDVPWPREEVVWFNPAFIAVDHDFGLVIPVQHLARLRSVPRLSPDMPYVVRIPLSWVPGELGLRAGQFEPVLRVSDGEKPAQEKQPMTSFDAAVVGSAVTPMVLRSLPDLYWALVQKKEWPDEELCASYLIDALFEARLSLLGEPGLAELLNLPPTVSWQGARQTWKAASFRRLAERVRLRRHDGGSVSLAELVATPGALVACALEPGSHPPPPDALRLPGTSRERLTKLLAPHQTLVNWEAAVFYSEEAFGCVIAAAQGGMLRALYNAPASAGGRALRALGLEPPERNFDKTTFLQAATRTAFRAGGLPMTTETFLVTLLQTPCVFLSDHREQIVESLAESRGQEVLAYLELRRAQFPSQALWSERLAHQLARVGRLEEASQLPLSQETQGILKGLEGDFEAALELCSRPLNRAEALCQLGRWQEVLHMLEEDASGEALVVRARALGSLGLPEGALKAAEIALQSALCPVSAHEARADALWELRRYDEARVAYRTFVEEARLLGLLENGVPERLARARERI